MRADRLTLQIANPVIGFTPLNILHGIRMNELAVTLSDEGQHSTVIIICLHEPFIILRAVVRDNDQPIFQQRFEARQYIALIRRQIRRVFDVDFDWHATT